MSISAFKGPLIQQNGNPLGSAGTLSANQNPDAGPSLWNHFDGLLDPRYMFTYGGTLGESKCYGFLTGGAGFQCINAVPSAIAAANIAASQTPAAAALTLVSSSGAGITVSTSITRADTGATVTGLLAIDSAASSVAFGQTGNVNIWDPSTMLSRNVRITSGGNDSGITFLVSGYDVYGFPMSEAITGANAGVASGVKAFKYIASITPSASVATTCSAGTGDVIGLPIRADVVGQCIINYNSTLVTAGTGFTAAVTTTATTTTGDVRGTYALQSASDASKRLVMTIMPTPTLIGPSTGLITGLFGVKQNLANNNGT
jgi:hypothetical protein